MNVKKVVATLAVATVVFSSQLAHLWASPSNVETITNDNKKYAPINNIIKQMGGQVTVYEDGKTPVYTINNNKVIVDEKWAFALINGEYVPYETKNMGDWTVPVYRTPVSKYGNTYVPINFLVSEVGLKLNVKDTQVTFDAVGENNSTATVDTVNVPSTSGSQSSSNTGSSSIVESNRPASNPKPSSGGNSNSGGTSTSNTTQTIYTGSEVKQKILDSNLGFAKLYSGLTLNPYGPQADSKFTTLEYTVGTGNRDMSLSIYQSSPEVDQKIKTILNMILPTQGSKLYSILDTPGLTTQTIELDSRTILIRVENYGLIVDFSPIRK